MRLSRPVRVAVVPRDDTDRISGGDMVMVGNIARHIEQLGVELSVVPLNKLDTSTYDAIHLTQIYQVGLAERVAEKAKNRRIPMLISPLYEDVLPIWFQTAVRRPGKWRTLAHLVGLRTAARLYVRWQGPRRRRSLEWNRQRKLLLNARLILNSQYERQHLARWFDLPNLDAHIVPLGVDAAVFGDNADADDGAQLTALHLEHQSYVLQVGAISCRKNQAGLLSALTPAQETVVLVGRHSPYEADYVKEVQQLADKRGQVVFLERVELATLLALYRGAAVHILPSWSERPGLVTLEAAACGCRVVSTNRAPIYEYLGDKAGYCDPDDLSSIRRSVRDRRSNSPPDLSQYVLNNITWQHTARRLKIAYDTILGS